MRTLKDILVGLSLAVWCKQGEFTIGNLQTVNEELNVILNDGYFKEIGS